MTSLTVPREGFLRLDLRFLRFGLLAWGGPVAQIAMVRHEWVDQERRVLGWAGQIISRGPGGMEPWPLRA